MKISIIQGAFLPVPALRGGAVEKRWHRLGLEFANCSADVRHISRLFEGLPAEEFVDGVEYLRVRGYDTPKSLLWLKFLDGLYSLRVRQHLLPADIVVTNTFWMPVLLRDAEKWGRVVVDFARMPKGQVRFYKHVACIRVNSKAVEQAVLQECPEVAPIVRRIPNPLPYTPPARLNLEEKEKVILYAGRIHPEKGLHLFADVWKELKAQFPDWRVEIAGSHTVADGGGGERYLQDLKQRFGDSPVLWHGPVNAAGELEKIYARASIFIYPSLAEKGETFGLAPLEAMAYGAVPVVSALECFHEFLNPGKDALVFNHRIPEATEGLGAALKTLLNDESKRNVMAVAAFARAKHFAPDLIAQRFLDLFKELIDAAGSWEVSRSALK